MNKSLFRLLSIKNSLKSEKGSFTIEASLVFPVIFLLVLSFIFISIFIYEKASLYYIASTVAERAAYNWNNSFKSTSTGELELGSYESRLYWRLADDKILDSLLSLSNNYQPIEFNINEDYVFLDSLPEKKLLLSAKNIPEGINGKLIYQNNIQRKVIVELESSLRVPSFVVNLIGSRIKARAYSTITEPVEFIRTIDFLRNYSYLLEKNKDTVKNVLNKQIEKEK